MPSKVKRDPNAPKRNLSAYLLYQNAMRDQFRALNPGMTFGQLSKYTSAMYSEMPPAEKQAWVARADADKKRYLQELSNYSPPAGYDAKGDAIQLNNPDGTVSHRPAKSGKAARDVHAPKRNMSAYLLYQNAMRDQFKRENPGMTFGQLAKYTSHMYKNLTSEERATWDTKAKLDKIRYDQELSQYVPPPGHDARGNLIDEHRPRRRNKRPPKDPDAPKRASGAYVFFTNEMRPMVMKQFPGIKFVEMGRILGERWRALTPEEKTRHEAMAQQDKMRFQLEMQQYTASQAAHQQQQQFYVHHAQAQAAVAGAQAAAQSMVASAGHQQQLGHQPQFHGIQAPSMQHPQAMFMDPHQAYYATADTIQSTYDPTKYQIPSSHTHHQA